MTSKSNILRLLISCVIAALISSCNGYKYLPQGEKLYTGATIEFESSDKIDNKKELKAEAEKMIRPQPNTKVLGRRLKLWLYNISGEGNKGIGKWVKNKLGEPPVYLSSVNPEQVSSLIDQQLFNKGVFKSRTESKIDEKEHEGSIVYTSHIHTPYRIKSVTFPQGNDTLSLLIRKSSDKSLLKEGDHYDLNTLNSERERIDEVLKSSGFFYFSNEYLIFKADTTNKDKTLDVKVELKSSVPAEALIPYKIKTVFVIPDYSLNESGILRDTIRTPQGFYIAADKSIKSKAIFRTVFIDEGDYYSRKLHNMTLNRLMGMGAFKFVNVRFDRTNDSLLNSYILLTPLPRKSVRTEFQLQTKSNNFTGPTLAISYRNRNALGGGELLIVNMQGSYEAQLSGDYSYASYSFGPEVELQIPRFLVPFGLKNRNSFFIPKTRINAGYNYLKRVGYFNLNSLKFIYGYRWKESIAKEHELNPININYTRLREQTPEFQELLETNPLLQKSFEEQFIAGITYNYTYNQQVYEQKIDQIYFNAAIELSGNLLSAGAKLLGGKTPNTTDPVKVAGSVYSQFARTELDFRFYHKTGKNSKLAARVDAGVGYSYGNSATLPYIKQFYSGGVSSIRAFRSRTLGPGSYVRPEESDLSFFEQGGDLKFETNVEYRFGLVSILKGAFFIDAGNIWLLRDNPATPGGTFKAEEFLSELAVGTGIGLRFDVTFFVLRFDLAAPLRKPWLPEGNRWVIDKFNPGSRNWRSENVVLNIAIGYPF